MVQERKNSVIERINLDKRCFHLNNTTFDSTHTKCYTCNPKTKFIPNIVNTNKYTRLTALPLSLWVQLKKPANLYFITTAFLTLIKNSPLNPIFSFFPIIFIIILSMIKDLLEDYSRFKSDVVINEKPTHAFKNNTFKKIFWKDIFPGDIVLIEEGETFPVDFLILGSSDNSGVAFIETSGFDGETNLKIRHASPLLLQKGAAKEQIANMFYTIEMGAPSKVLDSSGWDGIVTKDGEMIPLTATQFIPRSCVLKNTKWCIGVAVYTGKETKLALNSLKTKTKTSSISKKVDYVVIILVLFQLMYAIISFGLFVLWRNRRYNTFWYLTQDKEGKVATDESSLYLGQFISFIIVSLNLIPISLYIMLDMIRLIQAIFINYDLSMYDTEKSKFPVVRSSGLNEDLGRVSYLFTDKTGTLTENKMFFRNCLIASDYNKTYGAEEQEFKPTDSIIIPNNHMNKLIRPQPTHKYYTLPEGINSADDKFKDSEFFNLVKNDSVAGSNIDDFMLTLASCHTVLAYVCKDNDIDYQASSPDERCLVLQSAKYGYYFYGRKSEQLSIGNQRFDGQIILINIKGRQHLFEVLDIIEFTSDRKRMSVIVKDPRDNKIKIFCKGADSVIHSNLLESEKETFNHSKSKLNDFARKGLRTLCLASKIITEEEFLEWRDTKDNDKLESGLNFVGVTGIEDSLQEGVPDTVKSLLLANIQIWVLTGDKVETAINIARSAKIIPPHLSKENLLVIKSASAVRTRDMEHTLKTIRAGMYSKLETLLESATENEKSTVVVMTGTILDLIFPENVKNLEQGVKDILSETQTLFYRISKLSYSIICCRASPKQKEKLVKLIQKKTKKVVMSIGDGANDVPMIKRADIGIGLMGLEGTEAANSGDYSLGSFRFLKQLMFVHGSWNYARTCKTIFFFFFKNIIFSVLTMTFVFFNGFSATYFGHSSYSSYYNLFFTTLPVLFIGVFDTSYSKKTAYQNPELYSMGLKNHFFNAYRIMTTLLRALYCGLLNILLTIYLYNDTKINSGHTSGIALASTASMSAVVLVSNLYVIFETRNWNTMLFLTCLGSVSIWFVYLFLFSIVSGGSENYYWMGPELVGNFDFWSYLVIIISLSYIPVFIIKMTRRAVSPTIIDFVQEVEAGIKHKGTLIKNLVQNYNLRRIPIKRKSYENVTDLGYVPFGLDSKDDKVDVVTEKKLLNMLLKNK
eukprot:GAHX01001611.1.p1 GENE.GAHX01001611.1~~GAHX01001611.1.p1  ORF type:complete len:1200 (-),score=219.20 GAHX01001611.1:28-3627(-)